MLNNLGRKKIAISIGVANRGMVDKSIPNPPKEEPAAKKDMDEDNYPSIKIPPQLRQ